MLFIFHITDVLVAAFVDVDVAVLIVVLRNGNIAMFSAVLTFDVGALFLWPNTFVMSFVATLYNSNKNNNIRVLTTTKERLCSSSDCKGTAVTTPTTIITYLLT